MQARGVRVTLDTMSRAHAKGGVLQQPGRAIERFRDPRDPGHDLPALSPREASLARGAPLGASAPSPMTLKFFEGLVDDNTVIPPGPAGAAGPGHLVTMLNTGFAVFDKATGAIVFGPISAASFWSALGPPAASSFTPRVLYDQHAGRFLIAALSVTAIGNSHLLLAVSQASDPMQGFTLYAIPADPTGAGTADFPALGLDADHVYLTANLFAPSGFIGPTLWVFDKTTLLSGAAALLWQFDPRAGPMPGSSWQPAHSFDGGGTNYLIHNAGPNGGASFLRVHEVTFPGDAPVLRDLGFVRVAPFGSFVLEGAPQFSSDAVIDVLDRRLSNAILREGRLWTAHHVESPSGTGHTEIAWYEIDPSAADPNGANGPVQQGRIADAKRFFFFPSIAVNASGGAAVGFMGSGAASFPSAWYSARLPSDPPGTMRTPSPLKQGEDSYFKTFGGAFNRWGDFGATAVDPVDDTFWTLQAYARMSEGECEDCDRWGTWWGRFTTAPCALGAECSDGTFCNGEEECLDSVCVRTPVCDDGDPCTADACDESADVCRSTIAPEGTSCTDHLFCNGEETCAGGECLAGASPSCTGVDVCSTEACVETFDACGNLAVADGTSCADSVFCNGAEQGCFGGFCIPGPTPCADGNPCTTEACTESSRTCSYESVPDSEVPQGPDGICGTADDNAALFGRDRVCATGPVRRGDTQCDAADNCPERFNPDQTDSDGDHIGNLCDPLPCQLGRVFLAASGGGRVTRFNLTTGGRIVMAFGLARPTGVAVTPDGGAVYFTQAGTGELWLLDLTTGALTRIVTGLPGAAGLRIDADGIMAYVAQAGAGRVARVNLLNGTVVVVASGLSDPKDVALGDGGKTLFVTESGLGTVSSIDLETGGVTRIASDLQNPIGIAVSRDSATLFVVASPGELLRVDRESGNVQVAAVKLGASRYTALLYDDQTAIVTTQTGGALLLVDLNTGGVRTIATGIDVPEAISLDERASVIRLPRDLVGYAGTTVEIPILAKGRAALATNAISFQVTFNPEVIRLRRVKTGTLTEGRKLASSASPMGRVMVSISGDAPIVGTGSIAVLEFDAIGSPGLITPLDLDSVNLGGGRHPDCEMGSMLTISATPPSGGVPDGFLIPGTPLQIAHAAAGRIALSWGVSCGGLDTDFIVYESGSPDMHDARPLGCTTQGARAMTVDPPAGMVFYLVVPRSASNEGSWGYRSDGSPRPQSPSACLPQLLSTCSPKQPTSVDGYW